MSLPEGGPDAEALDDRVAAREEAHWVGVGVGLGLGLEEAHCSGTREWGVGAVGATEVGRGLARAQSQVRLVAARAAGRLGSGLQGEATLDEVIASPDPNPNQLTLSLRRTLDEVIAHLLDLRLPPRRWLAVAVRLDTHLDDGALRW